MRRLLLPDSARQSAAFLCTDRAGEICWCGAWDTRRVGEDGFSILDSVCILLVGMGDVK